MATGKTRVVIIMRGWPGSGKSTLCRAIYEEFVRRGTDPFEISVCSADHYHINKTTKKYEWKQENAAKAHLYCKEQFEADILDNDASVIFVDNTNIRRKEYAYYVDLARDHGYKVLQAHGQSPYKHSVEECFKRNVHNVPLEVITRMKDAFENDTELEHFRFPEDGTVAIKSSPTY